MTKKFFGCVSLFAMILLAGMVSAKMLSHSDPDGFKFDYPDDWSESYDDSVGVPNITYSSADGYAAFGVYVYPKNDKKMTALELLEGTLENLGGENMLSEDRIIPPTAQIKAAGADDAAMGAIEMNQSGFDMLTGITILVKGKKNYMYVQSVVVDYQNTYAPFLGKMAKSFRITGK